MPSINCRRGQTGGRPALVPFGNNGSSIAHCSSVRLPCPINRDHSQPKIHFRYTPRYSAAWRDGGTDQVIHELRKPGSHRGVWMGRGLPALGLTAGSVMTGAGRRPSVAPWAVRASRGGRP